MKNIEIYTDGACLGNPGPGGYAAILTYKENEKEISGGFKRTTNNRMELYAALAALETLKVRCSVIIYSDSRYLVDSIQKGWLENWQENNWMRTKNEEAVNRDLWERLAIQLNRHQVMFLWVKGHSNNAYNNRCDALAQTAAGGAELPEDTGYKA